MAPFLGRTLAVGNAFALAVLLLNGLVSYWNIRTLFANVQAVHHTQEVLAQLAGELPGFAHNGRTGAFRVWLRAITVNRLRAHWRDRPPACGGDVLELSQASAAEQDRLIELFVSRHTQQAGSPAWPDDAKP